jgi:hypothetical protein
MNEDELSVMPMGKWGLLPPKDDKCGECGREHASDQPHDKDSLYYQIEFQAAHGRGAQWSDAVAHCPPDIRAYWKAELEKYGVWSEPIERLTPEEVVARRVAGMPIHSEKRRHPTIPVEVLKRELGDLLLKTKRTK